MNARNTLALSLFSLFLLIWSGFASSQNVDDIMFVEQVTYAGFLDPKTGRRTTITALPPFPGAQFRTALMSPDTNQELAILHDQGVLSLTTSGVYSTLHAWTTPGLMPASMIADVDGSLVVGFLGGQLIRFDRNSNQTTLGTGLGSIVAMTLDGDTGDYILGSMGLGTRVIRVDRRTKQLTTLAQMNAGERIQGIDFQPSTGHFVILTNHTQQWDNLRLVDGRGRIKGSTKTTFDTTLFVDGRTGEIILLGANGIQRLTASFAPVNSHATQFGPASITLWNSRNVQGISAPKKGTTFAVRVNFEDSQNAFYNGAVFTNGLRPGLRKGGRTINANRSDPMFYASAAGLFEGTLTQGILGRLDSNGDTNVRIKLPAWLPTGTKLYFVCVAANGQKPGGIEIGNTIVIPVE